MFVDKVTSEDLATAMQGSAMGTDPNMPNRPALVPNELKSSQSAKDIVGSSFTATLNAVHAGGGG
jgi:hypothetical protein